MGWNKPLQDGAQLPAVPRWTAKPILGMNLPLIIHKRKICTLIPLEPHSIGKLIAHA